MPFLLAQKIYLYTSSVYCESANCNVMYDVKKTLLLKIFGNFSLELLVFILTMHLPQSLNIYNLYNVHFFCIYSVYCTAVHVAWPASNSLADCRPVSIYFVIYLRV